MSARCRSIALVVALGTALCGAGINAQTGAAKPAAAKPAASAAIDRGRYLAKIAGCNDCHTPGYMESAGNVPESKWLTGDTLGWRGPWGTTYASNLREKVPKMSEAEWVKFAKTAQLRPPMPWFALRDMTEADLRAVYRFIVRLGPGGSPAPAYVPPNQEPKPPFVTFPAPPK
jgi:mono/diheme cytochrome c family protein